VERFFFRHEFGRLCAVLTRSLAMRRPALVEDVAGAALVQALETWPRRGVPEAGLKMTCSLSIAGRMGCHWHRLSRVLPACN